MNMRSAARLRQVIRMSSSSVSDAASKTSAPSSPRPAFSSAAPEMIAGKDYKGLQVDIWSCGVILYAMLCGYLPFEDPNTDKLYKKILNCEYTIPSFIKDDARDLI